MNYANLLIIIIILIILYLIYNHFAQRESFTLESNITDKDTSIINSLSDLGNQFNNQTTITTDNILYDIYKNNTTNKINSDTQYVNNNINSLDSSLNNIKADLSVLDAHARYINIPDKKYKSIKSLQNGMDLSVTNITKKDYLININNQCLHANSVGNYNLVNCNSSDPGQIFSVNPIYTDLYYNAILEQGLNDSKLDTTDKINYPFIVLKSKANGNCLQNNHGSISIEPCKILKSQRWHGLDQSINCK
jgi:hypothetical protein